MLLTFPDSKTISDIMNKHMTERPEYEFTTHDKHTHRVWLVRDIKDMQSIQHEFDTIGSVYIADGHHRTASSHLLAEELKTKKQKPHWKTSLTITL